MNLENKILITGYDGYIGKYLINYLKKKKFRLKKLSLIKKNSIKFSNFTHLIHLNFYIGEKKGNLKKNLDNMNKVIKICENNNLSLIFPSTASFKYKNKNRVSKNLEVFNRYTRAKYECEKAILLSSKKKNLKYTILRIFNVYGGDLNNRYYISNIIKEFNRSKIFSKVYFKLYKNVRDFIHIDDLSNLILKVIKQNENDIFEVGSGKSISIQNLIKKINKISKKKNQLNFIEPKQSSKNFYSKSFIHKTKKTFNWMPKVSLEKGIKKLLIASKFLSS